MEAGGRIEFGRYTLRHLVAEGGMAEIFLAEQRGAGDFSKLVAIKRMLPHLTRQADAVQMFLDEARIVARFSHPNVVQVFDFGEIDGRYYLAMEYLAGESVSGFVRRARELHEPLPLNVVMQIAIGMLDGLHYAHQYAENGRPLNVVHRDVSPSNVIVTYQGHVKLVDFGIARAVDRQQERTATGIVKGKIAYASPEQIQGARDLDRRVDIFAAGVVLHELLTLHRLFRKETEIQSAMAVLNDPVPVPSSLRADVPAALDAIVMKALRRPREQRYQTAAQMRQELEQLNLGAPLRLDEFMTRLFGEERRREVTDVVSTISKIPTGIDARTQSGSHLAPQTLREREREGDQLTKESGRVDPARVARPSVPRPLASPELLALGDAALPDTREVGSPPPLPPLALPLRPSPPPPRRRALIGAAAGAGVVVLAFAAVALPTLLRRPTAEAEPHATPAIPEPVVAAAVTTGIAEIHSEPTGAAVSVAGHTGVTPLRLTELPVGVHKLTLTLDGHEPLTEVVEVKPGAIANISLKLQRARGMLEIDAPDKASLTIDGVAYGQAKKLALEVGEHRVSLTAPGFAPFSSAVVVAPNETVKLEAVLKPIKREFGKLNVACLPWCRVFVDGKDVGKPSPIVGLAVPVGSHELKMEHPPSRRSREVVISVRAGETASETSNFQ